MSTRLPADSAVPCDALFNTARERGVGEGVGFGTSGEGDRGVEDSMVPPETLLVTLMACTSDPGCARLFL